VTSSAETGAILARLSIAPNGTVRGNDHAQNFGFLAIKVISNLSGIAGGGDGEPRRLNRNWVHFVMGFGNVTVMSACAHARISVLLK
jgi:hypothetical protein